MVIFQLDVVHNWPNKLLQKSMDEKSSPSIAQARVFSFINHKMALVALTPKGPRVFWCKTTQNYPLLKKEPVSLFRQVFFWI
jgi:hypothetical protein